MSIKEAPRRKSWSESQQHTGDGKMSCGQGVLFNRELELNINSQQRVVRIIKGAVLRRQMEGKVAFLHCQQLCLICCRSRKMGAIMEKHIANRVSYRKTEAHEVIVLGLVRNSLAITRLSRMQMHVNVGIFQAKRKIAWKRVAME